MTIAFADATLARRVERGWAWTSAASARALAGARPELGAACAECGGGMATFFGPGSPLSQAQGLGLLGPVEADELDRLDAFFETRGAVPAVEVATLADPGLLPALSARGYRVAETTHMLIRPVESEPRPSPLPLSLSLPVAVTRVDPSDRAACAAFSDAVMLGFFEGHTPPDGLADMLDAMTVAEGTTVWLARLDRIPGTGPVPAGGASLLVHDGLALFAGDATVPDCRRRGVQSALIHARLAEAARLECDLAVTCVQPGCASQRNYERHAFRMAYARVLMVREPGGST